MGYARRIANVDGKGGQGHAGANVSSANDALLRLRIHLIARSPAAPPTFIPGENALLALGSSDTSTPTNGMDLSVGPHTGGLPFTPTSILPARPNLPDDPIIPHNGFQTFEEGEKAFMHLLRKAGVDASWTWDQTMRAIITDPLYKALGTLAEKKAAWQKVCIGASLYDVRIA